MSKQKYERIKDIEFNYYQLDAPVEIIKGAILLNNQNNSVLLQLKLNNVSNKKISAVYITVDSYDTANDLIPGIAPIEHSFLDLEVKAKDSFGDKYPIVLHKSVRNIKAIITKVVFTTGDVWRNENTKIFEKPKQDLLNITDRNLLTYLKQKINHEGYNSEVVKYCPVMIDNTDNFWLCTCGRPNTNTDECLRCGMNEEFIFMNMNEEFLRDEYIKHLSDLAIEVAKEKKKREKRIKTTKKITAVIFFLSLSIFGLIYISGEVRNYGDYKEVLLLMKNQKYLEAMTKIDVLGDYKDTREIYSQAKYNYALKLYDEKKYESALKYLDSDFGDSSSWINTIQSAIIYNEAKNKIEDKEFEDAIQQLETLKGYKDSDELLIKAKYGYAVSLFINRYFYEAKKYFDEIKGIYDVDEYLNSLYYRIEGSWLNTSTGITELFYYSEHKVLIHKYSNHINDLFWSGDDFTLTTTENRIVRVRLFRVISISEDNSTMKLMKTAGGEIFTYKRNR